MVDELEAFLRSRRADDVEFELRAPRKFYITAFDPECCVGWCRSDVETGHRVFRSGTANMEEVDLTSFLVAVRAADSPASGLDTVTAFIPPRVIHLQ